jgi:hypothetical protein
MRKKGLLDTWRVAGEENTMFNFTHDNIDLYRLCAKLFNDFIGLDSPKQHPTCPRHEQIDVSLRF